MLTYVRSRRPEIKAGPADVGNVDADFCLSAGFGPGVELSVEGQATENTKLKLGLSLGIDAPKLQTCLSAAYGSLTVCHAHNICSH